jgi:hypothetical protein
MQGWSLLEWRPLYDLNLSLTLRLANKISGNYRVELTYSYIPPNLLWYCTNDSRKSAIAEVPEGYYRNIFFVVIGLQQNKLECLSREVLLKGKAQYRRPP